MSRITIDRAVVENALGLLIENARLLGATQAKKGFGCYSQEDARLERAWREGIAKHSAALRAALAAPQQAEPVHSLVSDAEYLRLFEDARKGSDRASGVLRGIRAVIAAYEAAAPQQAEPQWIACSERMPEEGLAVLIIDIDGDYDIGRWNGNDEWFTFSRNAYSFWEVKHWMPMPALPGKGGA